MKCNCRAKAKDPDAFHIPQLVHMFELEMCVFAETSPPATTATA